MYTVTKRMEISGAHSLTLPYESECTRLHGHNWVIEVTCRSRELNSEGMVVDFKDIKKIVKELDHRVINELIDGNPTAERIAKYLCDKIPHCVKVAVQETEGNTAVYERD